MTDIPNGAIYNGREHFRRLEDHYDFQCEGGPLSKCSDFDGAKRCFEALAEHVTASADSEREKKVEALVEAAKKIDEQYDPDMGWCPVGPSQKEVFAEIKSALSRAKGEVK